MCSHRRVGVLREGCDHIIFYIKAKNAMAIVAEGFAEMVDDGSIRITKPAGLIMARSSDALTASTQERVYESVAIEKNRQIFNGGMCRTEHQPRKFSNYTGARVGHQ